MYRYFYFSFLLLVYTSTFGQESRLKKEIEKIINYDSDISYELTPGFVVGVIDGDSTYFIPFGKNKLPYAGPIDPHQIFEIGSVTKSITAALVFALQQKGMLNTKDKVNDYIPLDSRNPRLKNLTIDDLLNHMTSFSRRPANFGEKEEDAQDPYKYYTKQDLLEYYKNFVVDRKDGFHYSHTAYALLELVIESCCKCSFHDAVDRFIFQPLDMETSFVNLKEKKVNIITTGVDRAQEVTQPWSFSSFSGSEGIRSSAVDILKFFEPFFNKSSTSLDLIFPAITKQFVPSYNDKMFYSNGWHIVKVNKKIRAVVNNGTTSGHSCFVGMVPETKTGVVILSNSAHGTHDLGMLVLRMINYNWKRKA